MSSQSGVEPVTDEVQVTGPATMIALFRLTTGATPATSGATERSPRAAASSMVSVVDEPSPVRTPPEVTLPGVTVIRLCRGG